MGGLILIIDMLKSFFLDTPIETLRFVKPGETPIYCLGKLYFSRNLKHSGFGFFVAWSRQQGEYHDQKAKPLESDSAQTQNCVIKYKAYVIIMEYCVHSIDSQTKHIDFLTAVSPTTDTKVLTSSINSNYSEVTVDNLNP